MEICVDSNAPPPQYEQLIDQIKSAVSSGCLKPGDPLPSIRQLANDLGLNNKTVAKAYRLLERDSVIQTRGYRGTFIHPEAIDNCQFDLQGWIRDTLDGAITRLRARGATDSEIRNLFSACMNNRATVKRSTAS
jgi:GntR family transcriptional regulator